MFLLVDDLRDCTVAAVVAKTDFSAGGRGETICKVFYPRRSDAPLSEAECLVKVCIMGRGL